MSIDPIQKFAGLYAQMQQADLPEPSAVVLATATPEGTPSARVVLLKGFDEQGFVFYTNLGSQKAHELRDNPKASLCFYWEPIHYQVRVQGAVAQVADEEADAYFASRPRGSQIGAWASKQSASLESRDVLEARFREYENRFEGETIPRPDFWSGFRIRPDRIEFWKRRENRLHERTVFIREESGWNKTMLYP